MKKFLYWLPRILAILFIFFISLFSLDALEQKQWFLALIIHLIPSCVLIIATAIAWKHEIVGGWLFLGAGGVLLYLSSFESWIVSALSFVIGVLFWANKNYPLKTSL